MSVLRLKLADVTCHRILRLEKAYDRELLEDRMIELYIDLGKCAPRISDKYLFGFIDAIELVRNVCNHGGVDKRLNIKLYKRLKNLPAYLQFRDTLESLKSILGDKAYNVFRSWLRGNYSYNSAKNSNRKFSGANIFDIEEEICGVSGCRNVAVLTCSFCMVETYCSKACQRKHWRNGHKDHCSRCTNPSSTDLILDSSTGHLNEKGTHVSLLTIFSFMTILIAWLYHVFFILE